MKKHITSLDGLRGIAVLLVLFTHLLPHRATPSFFLRAVNGIAGAGWAGVDIFFVLSGFLITGILFDSKGTEYFFRNFYMRRTLRIVPLYLLLVFCCMEVFPHFAATQGSAPAGHRWMFWLYLSNVLVAIRGAVPVGWLGPLWSLAVEEHFYLVWPAVIFLCSREAAIRVCLGCIIVANLTRIWFVAYSNLFGSYVFTLSRMDDLALGALAALALRGRLQPAVLQTFALRTAVVSGVGAGVILLWRHGVILDPVMLTAGLTVIGVFSASMLLLAVLPGTATAWKRGLDTGLLRQFGKYSYGMYMLHMPVSELMHQHHLLVNPENRGADIVNLLLQIAVTFLVALISFHCFERYFLQLKRFFEPDTKHMATAIDQTERGGSAAAAMEVHRL